MHTAKAYSKEKEMGNTVRIVLTINTVNVYCTECLFCNEGRFIILCVSRVKEFGLIAIIFNFRS